MSPLTRQSALAALEATFARDFPLTHHIGVRIGRYTGDLLELTAPLGPNVNAHGTGFAGSSYSLAALCGWGLIFLRLREADIAATLVMTRAEVQYDQPVTSDLVATCDVSALPEPFADVLHSVATSGRARLALPVTVGPSDSPAARLTTHYVVRLQRPPAVREQSVRP